MSYRKVLVFGCMFFWLSACVSQSYEGRQTAKEKSAEVNAKLGMAYLRNGEVEAARDKLFKALSQDAKSSLVHLAMAEFYRTTNDPENTIKHYRKSLALNPYNAEAHNNLGVYLCGQGRFDEAEKEFLAAENIHDYPTPGIAFLNAGICAQQAGNLDKAERFVRRALELNPKNSAILFELGSVSYQQENYLSARGVLQRYHEKNQPTSSSLYLAAQTELKLGALDLADKYSQELMDVFPQSREAQMLRNQ